MNENAASIDAARIADPRRRAVNLATLGPAGDLLPEGPFAIGSDPFHRDEPDWRAVGRLTAGYELHVLQGTEPRQSGCIYEDGFRPAPADVARMLRADCAGEDWGLIDFRIVVWLLDGGRRGWSLVVEDLNDGGVDRLLADAYDAVDRDGDGALADLILDRVAAKLGDRDGAIARFSDMLAERYGLDGLPSDARDFVRAAALERHAPRTPLAAAMVCEYSRFARFLALAGRR